MPQPARNLNNLPCMFIALISFAQPQWLLLGLLLLPAFAWVLLYRRWHQKVREQWSAAWFRRHLQPYSAAKATGKQLLYLSALGLVVLAVAQPRLRTQGATVEAGKGRDVVVVLDVSNSMLAADLAPNRLERARQLAERFVNGLDDDRVALVLFAGNAYLSMPLTTDAGAFRLFLQAATPDAVPLQGTAIGPALQRAWETFPPNSGRNRFVLLLTDGEDHDAAATDQALRLREEGVLLLVVGIGTAAGAPVPDGPGGGMKTDADGQPVISRLNEALLRQLAANGGGMYGTLTDTEAMVNDLLQVVNRYEKTVATGSRAGVQYLPLFPWLLLLALALLVWDLQLSNRKKLKTAIALLCLLPVAAGAQQADLQKGNRAYHRQQYARAAEHYRNALQKEKLPSAAYNLGNALFEQQQLAEAIRWYTAAATDAPSTSLRAQALYNKGVALHQNKQLPEAIAAYKEALLLAPADRAIRINLQLALQEQRRQQQLQQNRQQPSPLQQDRQKQQTPPPAKINRRQAEQYLQALREQERLLQEKMQKKPAAAGKPEKDW